MASLQEQGSLKTNTEELDFGLRDVTSYEVAGGTVIVAATGIGGGVSSYFMSDGGAITLMGQTLYEDEFAAGFGDLSLEVVNGGEGLMIGGLKSGAIQSYDLDPDGQIGNGQELNVAGQGSYGAIAQTEAGNILTANAQGSGFDTYSQAGSGALQHQHSESDTGASHATQVVDIKMLTLANGTEVAISASQGEQGISSYTVNGVNPGFVDSVGPADGLGMMVPTDMAVVDMFGQSFVIVASAPSGGSSGALSVMSVGAGGGLSVTDHILDGLDTRFGSVQAVDAIEIGGRWFVAAGGGDAGISLFAVMPGGVLQHLDTIADSLTTGLSGVSGITLVDAGGDLQIFVASNSDEGLTHLSYDLAGQGETKLALAQGGTMSGSSGGDILSGQGGADTIAGGNGDDVIRDGAGIDRMTGGAGADTFVLDFDGDKDTITNFNAAEDTIDLSYWPFLYDVGSLQITQLSNGVRISHRGEVLDVLGDNTIEEVRDAIGDGPARSIPSMYDGTGTGGSLGSAGGGSAGSGGGDPDPDPDPDPEPEPDPDPDPTPDPDPDPDPSPSGPTTDADMIIGSDAHEAINGLSGNDTIKAGAGNDVIFGAGDDDLIFGEAGNDSIGGGGHNDTIYGEGGKDFLKGGGGDDMLHGGGGDNKMYGQAGDDMLIGGSQKDTLNGGSGDDSLNGQKGDDSLKSGTGDDSLDGGGGDDVLYSNAGADLVMGGDGNDRLITGGGDDVLVGGAGDDYLKGGGGSDTFVFAAGMGADEVRKFHRGQDMLEIDADLLDGQTTGAEVLADYGSIEGSHVVLDFGDGDAITLLYAKTMDGMFDNISIV